MLKYFLEIKNRLVLVFISWFSLLIVSYVYKEILLFMIVQINFVLNLDEDFLYFIFTNITEIFSVYIKLVFFFSFQLFLISFLYHFFLFLTPALFKKEYLNLVFLFRIAFLVWLVSLVVANYLLIPLTWNFFLSFQSFTADYSFNLHFEAKLNEYIDFYIALCYLCIIYFNSFILIVFVTFLSLTNKNIRKFRKIYYYFFVIFSTLVSPPEIFSQFIISLITIVIFECFIFFLLLNKNIN